MRADLTTTWDVDTLISGSLEALHTDADELDARADALSEAAAEVSRHVVAGWLGSAADGWAERRALLEHGLTGVADVFRAGATALRAYADVVAWARERAGAAVDLWANPPQLSAFGGVHATSTRGLPPGMLSAQQVFGDGGDPFGVRSLAAAVLADAQEQVRHSAEALAALLDELSAGLPDGRWHPDQFIAGIGDWLRGVASMLPLVLATRTIVDHDGMTAEARVSREALMGLLRDPDQAVPTLLDTQMLEDNPARWWGGAAPDLALTAVGAGALSRLRRVNQLADPVGSALRSTPQVQAGVLAHVRATSLTANVPASKFEFIFGRVTSSPHNLERSIELQRHFARIGVYDDAGGRSLILEHLDDVVASRDNIVRTLETAHGRQEIRDSLFVGPRGLVHLETTWVVEGSVRRLTTVVPYGRLQ